MKPLPSPSRAAIAATSSTFGSSAFSSSTFGSRPEQDYIAAAYSGHMLPPQTSTFSSVRSSPSATFQNQHVAHQHQRNAGMQQQLDDILQNDYMQISHEHRRPATPPALSSAEADALRLQLQASSAIRLCIIALASSVFPCLISTCSNKQPKLRSCSSRCIVP